MPARLVIHEDQPNTFANGGRSEWGTVAVNTGLLDMFSCRGVRFAVSGRPLRHDPTLGRIYGPGRRKGPRKGQEKAAVAGGLDHGHLDS